MAKILIALAEADGPLYRLARRVAERGPAAPRERIEFRTVVLELCRREAGAAEDLAGAARPVSRDPQGSASQRTR